MEAKVPREVLLKNYNYDLNLKENLKRLKEEEGIEASYRAAYWLLREDLKSYRAEKNKEAEELFLEYKKKDKTLSLEKIQKIIKEKEGKFFKLWLLKKIRLKHLDLCE